jgi:hypothetical protein
MAANLTTLDPALKRILTQDRLEMQYYDDTLFLDSIQKKTRVSIGEVARVPLHVGRSGSYTALPAGGGSLNTAGNQALNKAEYNYTNHHQNFAIQGEVIDGTATNTLSVAEAVVLETQSAVQNLRRQAQRQLFLNGDALITACIASTTNDVDLNATGGKNAIDRGWLFEGLPIDVGSTSNEVLRVDNSLITAVDAGSTPAVTVAAGAETAETTSDYVSVANSRSGTASYEMNGLRNLVSTSADFGGLTVAGESTWQAASVDTTSQALTLSLMLQQDQAIHQKTGKKCDFLLTGLKQERKFYEQLQQQVRYGSDASIDAGDSEAAKWRKMRIFTEPDCQDEDMYFGQLKHIFIVAIDKPYFQNKHTGGKILDWIQDTDSYGGKVTYRIQLATNRRNAFARLGGLT